MRDRKIGLTYSPGGERRVRQKVSKTVSTPEEAASYIDLLMNRMPYDTERIEAAIGEANERKRAYERVRTEPGSEERD